LRIIKILIFLFLFSFTTHAFAKSNENIAVVSEKNCICYSFNKANGPHPDRYQSRDDYTDWLKSDVGIKSLNEVLKILKK
jgi:hypothetical protein